MCSTQLVNCEYAARGRGVAPVVAGEPEELPVFGLEQFGGAPMVPPRLPERKSASTVALMSQQADGERR
jgi:hypothetical protein